VQIDSSPDSGSSDADTDITGLACDPQSPQTDLDYDLLPYIEEQNEHETISDSPEVEASDGDNDTPVTDPPPSKHQRMR
jgi:hypothetical protein